MSGISFNPDAGNNGGYNIPRGDISKITTGPKFNMAEELKKMVPVESADHTYGVMKFKISNETSITDKDGNLKSGVDPQKVLNKDGTLKPGWTVDQNGVPKYSKIGAMFDELVAKEDGKSFRTDPGFVQRPDVPAAGFMPDPGFVQRPDVPAAGFIPDPGFVQQGPDVPDPGFRQDIGFIRGNERQKYELKDGKLVPLPKTEPIFPRSNLKDILG